MQAARTLFDAAKDGNIEEIRALLEVGANPDDFKDNVPAIYQAVIFGHEAAAMVLLAVTAPKLLTKQHSYYGTTALHHAALKGMENFLKTAIASGADPDVLQNNVPAVWYAAGGRAEVIAMFLLEVTDPRLLSNKHSYTGATILHEAAAKGMGNLVKAAIERGADPDILDERNVPAVWGAIWWGHEATAMMLLEMTDARLLNIKNSAYGTTLLHEAASKCSESFVEAAISRGADPDILDERNVPAVWEAAYSGHETIAMALLKKTDPKLLNNKNTNTDTTALHHAAAKGMWGFIKAAIATKCIEPDAHSLDGQSWFALIKMSSLGEMEKQALIKDVMDEHAWAKRGSLVMLRHRLRQAWEAECDAEEAAAAAQAPSASPDA